MLKNSYSSGYATSRHFSVEFKLFVADTVAELEDTLGELGVRIMK